jgi:hypothetical protein
MGDGCLTSLDAAVILTFTPTNRSEHAMQLSKKIKPISYFKDNAAKAIAEMTATREPSIITQNDEATCVIKNLTSAPTF